jgi:phage gp37-like protein
MAMIDTSEIEEEMIAALQSNISYLKTVGPVGEFLTSKVDELPILCPAAYVSYMGGNYTPVGNTSLHDKTMFFAVLVVIKNYVSMKTLLHGDGSHKGAHEVLADVIGLFSGSDLDLQMEPFEPINDEAISGNRNVAVYGITFKTRSRG